VARTFEAIVMRALARTPADRYGDADELLTVLERLRRTVRAATTLVTPPPLPKRRERTALAYRGLAAAVIIALAVGGAMSAAFAAREPATRPAPRVDAAMITSAGPLFP
jgi:hypothetical protein